MLSLSQSGSLFHLPPVVDERIAATKLGGSAIRHFALAPRLLERMHVPLTREMFSFRSDSDLAQLAALRAGFGIGPSQLGVARRDKNLIPVLHAEFIYPIEVWLVMHRDLRSSRRIRILFDRLAAQLLSYTHGSHFEKK